MPTFAAKVKCECRNISRYRSIRSGDRSYFCARSLIAFRTAGTLAHRRSFNSGKRWSHFCKLSSELKRLVTPQPPPRKTTVETGSTETNCPLSKTTRIRAVLSGEESSTTIFSFEYLLPTSSMKSTAQFVLKRRPLDSVTVWKRKSSRGSQFM